MLSEKRKLGNSKYMSKCHFLLKYLYFQGDLIILGIVEKLPLKVEDGRDHEFPKFALHPFTEIEVFIA